jgi:hypothetical protein
VLSATAENVQSCVIVKCYYGRDGLGRERQQNTFPANIGITYLRTWVHKFLQNSGNHIQILCSRRVMRRKFRTENSQL